MQGAGVLTQLFFTDNHRFLRDRQTVPCSAHNLPLGKLDWQGSGMAPSETVLWSPCEGWPAYKAVMLACVLRRSQGTLLTLSTAARHSIKEPAQAEKGTGLLSAVKQFAKGLTFTLTSPTKGRRLSPSAAQGKAAAEG